MPVRPTRPGIQQIVVPTINPKAIGQTVPQQALPAQLPPAATDKIPTFTAWPRQRFAVGSGEGIFDKLLATTLSSRYSDAYAMLLLAARNGYSTDTSAAEVKTLLPNATFRRYDAISPFYYHWDEYKIGSKLIIALYADPPDLRTYYNAGQSMVSSTLFGSSWLFAKDYKTELENYWTAFTEAYPADIASLTKTFVFTGYGLGGAYAHWLAFMVNKISAATSESGYPSIASYSFSAPSLWNLRDSGFTGHDHHRAFAYMQRGDPVPGMVQLRTAERLKAGEVFLGIPPLLNADYFGDASSYGDAFAYSESAALQYIRDLDAERSTIDQYVLHKEDSYCRAFQQACRDRQDTPIGYFDAMVNLDTAIHKGVKRDLPH